ncbi:hypothetical protein XA68_10576 [Ophiocordyceps unilateralis]|uniref:J domain-containing protein n=1 Tax=Ophiocordyceps unilateralis TaxID=268505 RepID=A0A2A9PHH4_OPHUN|nr:hypothetical protein XA68_10576 [Ophiocordyceps unilateralis]
MSGDNADLLRFASEYADQDVDLYDLLGVDALITKEDIHRAWRKRSLKYHPDKAGDQFDASKWELFERARDVLSDASARAAYDQASKAKLLRRQERQAMDQERQRFADDLESREQTARQQQRDREQARREAIQRERERLAEAERARLEEQKRQAEAAQEAEDVAEAKRRLQEKKEERARRKQAKDAIRPWLVVDGGSSLGPTNGLVDVPGDYPVGADGKCYWELVCDKLRAVQALRNFRKRGDADAEVQEAETKLLEVRAKIHEAEVKYQQESAAGVE